MDLSNVVSRSTQLSLAEGQYFFFLILMTTFRCSYDEHAVTIVGEMIYRRIEKRIRLDPMIR